MQKAAFSIVKYQFSRVFIDLKNHTNNEICLDFDTKGVFEQINSIYELIFTVKAFNENIDAPFVEIECIGTFEFENVTNMVEIPDYFYKNSIALLFPYLRAYISIVTTQANVPGILLPTLNLSGLESSLKENTIQK